MAFERLGELGLEWRAPGGGAEGAVARGPSGTAGDLGELGRVEPPELIAVELAVGGESDVIDVEIEPHADRVCGDQIFDIAGLIERDLRVAAARAERPHYHRGTAPLAADQFGYGVDFLGREGDDGGAPRQARDLLLAGKFQPRQPWPGQHVGARQQPLDHRPHGLGAQHQGLFAPAAIEHAVGEDVAALQIRAQLYLVDRHEGDIEVARHRLHGGDPEARIGRLDLLLAGHQRDRLRAGAFSHFIVDLARQEPQRQPDDPGGMGQHALDGEVRLAGIGRSENSGDTRTAGAGIASNRRGKGDGHLVSGGRNGSADPYPSLLYHNATGYGPWLKQ